MVSNESGIIPKYTSITEILHYNNAELKQKK